MYLIECIAGHIYLHRVCSQFVFSFCLRLRQDRLRQEQLARERLAQLRNRRKAKEAEAEEKLVTDGDVGVLQEAVVKALERKHQDERQVWTSFVILR